MMSQEKVCICLAYATNTRGVCQSVARLLGIKSLWLISRDRTVHCACEFYKNGDSATVFRKRFCNIRSFRHLNEAPSIPLIRKRVKHQKGQKTFGNCKSVCSCRIVSFHLEVRKCFKRAQFIITPPFAERPKAAPPQNSNGAKIKTLGCQSKAS